MFKYLTDVFPRVKLNFLFMYKRVHPRAFLPPYFLPASYLNIFASSPRLADKANSSLWKELIAGQRSLLCTSICPFRWAYPWRRNFVHHYRQSNVNLKLSHHEYKIQADCLSISSISVAFTHFCWINCYLENRCLHTHTHTHTHTHNKYTDFTAKCFHCDISSEDFYL